MLALHMTDTLLTEAKPFTVRCADPQHSLHAVCLLVCPTHAADRQLQVPFNSSTSEDNFLHTRSDRPQTLLYVTPYTKFHTNRAVGLGVDTRTHPGNEASIDTSHARCLYENKRWKIHMLHSMRMRVFLYR
jgi:hypothetical protein